MEPLVLVKEPFPHFVIQNWTNLNSKLSVGFSTRIGGISKEPYQSLNLGLHVGDQQNLVIENRKRIATLAGFSFEAWTSADQVHGSQVKIVTLEHRGKGRLTYEDTIQQSDGIVTNQDDILLTSFYADCTPLYFFDPVKKVIGLAHAGWKGTVLKIGKEMVQTMVEKFGSKEEDIRVAIGPSIGQCCYEVNNKVIIPLKKSISFIPLEMVIDKKNGHYDLDLKKANKQILIEAGILPNHIEISSYCTSCETSLFFSHRRDQGQTGRMAAWIGFRKDE